MWLGSLADRTKRNASVCSQPIAAHTEGGKRWAQHGAGGEPGRRESRGGGLLNRKDAVLYDRLLERSRAK